VKVVSDVELFRLFLAEFGVRRTATLFGWATIWGLSGALTKEAMLTAPLGATSTRYRVLADFRRMRSRLRENGYVISADGSEESDVEELVRMAAAA
jgi:hypothetical protein